MEEKMKCCICGKEIISKELYKGDFEAINGAVVGDYIEIKGHKTCCQAVDELIVIPNRLRIMNLKEAEIPASSSNCKSEIKIKND